MTGVGPMALWRSLWRLLGGLIGRTAGPPYAAGGLVRGGGDGRGGEGVFVALRRDTFGVGDPVVYEGRSYYWVQIVAGCDWEVWERLDDGRGWYETGLDIVREAPEVIGPRLMPPGAAR